MFSYRVRPLDRIIGGANLVRSIDLPRKDLLSQIVLRLSVGINITTLGSPVYFQHAPARIVRRIEVVADGKDTIHSINMQALVMKNFFLYGNYPRRTVPALSTGLNTLTQTVVLPIAIPRSVRPIDTLINTEKLSTFVLQATFGDHTSIFSTQPTTHSLTSVEITPHIVEAVNVNVPPDKLNFSVYKQLTIEKEVTVSTPEFQILLPVGNYYRGFLIEATANHEVSDTVINRVEIRSGTTVFAKANWMDLREMNALNLGMESQVFTGYAYIDFCPEGRLVDALNATKLSMLEAVFDVTKQAGINLIRIYPCELIVPMIV